MGAGKTVKGGIELVETFLKELNKPSKPLTQRQFETQFAQHIDLRGRENKNQEENIKSVLEEGFRKGFGPNAVPPYAGGAPLNIMSERFKPQSGDVVYLAPKGAWKRTPNGMQIIEGWKPEPEHIIRIQDPNQSMYEAYIANISKGQEKATSGDVHMMGGGRPPKKTTLEEDLKSFKDPALALADLLAGALRGTTTAATGFAGDMEELYRQYGKGAIANAVRQLVPTREGKATTLPTIEEMNAMLPSVVPAGAGRSTQVADIGQFLGENNPAAPTAIAAVKPVVKAALPLARKAGQAAKKAALSDDMAYALENLESKLGLGPKQIMIGPKAKTYRHADADLAAQMEREGKNKFEIWEAAKTFRGPDGVLLQEIADSGMKYTPDEIQQKQIDKFINRFQQAKDRANTPEELKAAEDWGNEEKYNAIRNLSGKANNFVFHPELFDAYPELSSLRWKQLDPTHDEFTAPEGTQGFFSPLYNKIVINNDAEDPRSTALHELQHAIQKIEGRQGGSSPEFMAAKMVEREEAKQRLKKIQDRIDYERGQDPVAFANSIAQDELSLRPIQSTLEQTKSLEGITNPYNAYKLASGEEEARMVQRRKDFDENARRFVPPYLNYEADPSLHITDFADGGAVMMADGGMITIEEFLRKQGY
jgi:hypothetical protein